VRHRLSIISGVSRRPERDRVTLHDVARLAGVSYATASRVMNGSDRTVRPENAVRVRAVDPVGNARTVSRTRRVKG